MRPAETVPERIWVHMGDADCWCGYHFEKDDSQLTAYVREDTRTVGTASSELLPCPFCGAIPIAVHGPWTISVRCSNRECECSGVSFLLALWNTRTRSPVGDVWEAVLQKVEWTGIGNIYENDPEKSALYCAGAKQMHENITKALLALEVAKSTSTPVCVKCGHNRVNQHGVCVMIRDGVDTDYYHGNPCCMCKCEFPAASTPVVGGDEVEAALAELREMFPDMWISVHHGHYGKDKWKESWSIEVSPVGKPNCPHEGVTLPEAMQRVREWKEQQ